MAKKNTTSIVAAVVALAAAAVPFVVASGWVTETSAALSARVSVASNVDAMSGKSRKLPLVDPDQAEAKPLEMFPTDPVIKAGKEALEQLTRHTAALQEASIKLNLYKPLIPEAFTAPAGVASRFLFQFRDEYAKSIPEGLNTFVRGSVPYTQEQIAAAIQLEKRRIENERGIRQGGTIINMAEIQQLQLKADTEVPMKLRNDTALNNQVYVSPDTWTVAPGIAGTRAPRVDDAWMAQMGLWIQMDVAQIVLAANKASPNIYRSPVKHLVRVYVPPDPYFPARVASGEGQSNIPVSKVNAAGAIQPNKATNFIGRMGNGLYDVVHYDMVVRVTESEVARFLAEIPRSKLHYVLDVQMKSVDSPIEGAMGYLYGNDPVVELTLKCEALFLRQWTQAYMPRGVKTRVGMDDPVAVTPPG